MEKELRKEGQWAVFLKNLVGQYARDTGQEMTSGMRFDIQQMEQQHPDLQGIYAFV
jgi:hypothetical protein